MATAEQIEARLAALEQARVNIALAIEEATLNPRVDYEVDGQIFSWGKYIESLTSQLLPLDQAIQRLSKYKITWLGKKRTQNGTLQ